MSLLAYSCCLESDTTEELPQQAGSGGSGYDCENSVSDHQDREVRAEQSPGGAESGELFAVVIDDSEDDREVVLGQFPQSRFARCYEFGSVEDFVNRFIHRRKIMMPAVMFIDIRIDDGKDGIELLKKIRRSRRFLLRKVPVVIISGSEESDDVQDAYASGANLYISKGLSPRDWQDTIKQVLHAFGAGKLPTDTG